jgi:(p)ppGpp synthase/HD superfamily hydrolase
MKRSFQDEMKLVNLAHEIATRAHAGQTRKNGVPYITHAEAVATIIDQDFYTLMPYSEAARNNWVPMKNYIIMAALLHDTFEDTDITEEDLVKAGFPIIVIEMVRNVTKLPGETYFDFIMRLQETGHIGSKMVKLADLRHNLSDLKEGTMKDKYRFAQYILSYFNK